MRACERFGIIPPDAKKSWDECDVWTQALLLAYDSIRETERLEELEMMLKCGVKLA